MASWPINTVSYATSTIFYITYLWLLSLLEELLLSLLLVTLLPCEVLITSDLINLLLVNTRQINLIGSGNNVAGIDSSKRNTVNLEWTSYEKDTLGKVLEQDDALATESASEEDENCTGCERWSRS